MVLFATINNLVNPNTGSARRRWLFIPPSTNKPLFSYGQGDDQRLFLSLIENGSVYLVEEDASDAASVSTSRSLPSTLASGHDDQESFHSWLLEEHQRRYSATNSEEDLTEVGPESGREARRKPSIASHASLAPAIDYTDFAGLKTSTGIEFRMLFRYLAPLIVTFILEHFFAIVCLLVVGHLGKNELAAVSLGSMTSTITFAIFEGIATALDTLCPQAYGAGNFELVSIYVQRGVVFSWAVFVPCGLLWWYSGFFLKYVIESERVLHLTVTFLRIEIIGAPAYIFFENMKRFLQAQGIFEAGTGVLFVTAPFNIFLSYFLVWNERFGMGFIGAPIAAALNFWFMCILMVLYVVFIDGNQCWFGIRFDEVFKDWKRLLQLAIPGIIMLLSEYMAYEFMTLFASYFGTTALAAQSAVASIASVTYMVPFAVGIASTTRIANFIGAQNLEAAKISTKTGLLLAVSVASVNGLVLFIFKRQIAGVFTKDEEVIREIVSLFNPLVPILHVFDGVAAVSSGILRAQGLQKIGGVINFFSYYAFALPLALVLSKMAKLELVGLWIGIGSGMFLCGFSEVLVILNSDWESIMVKAGMSAEYFEDDDDDEESI